MAGQLGPTHGLGTGAWQPVDTRKECTFEEEPAVCLFSPLSPRDLCYVKAQVVSVISLLVHRPLCRSVCFHVYRGMTIDVHSGGDKL